MQYRPLGKTGMNASVVGLGAEHLDNKPYAYVEETIHAALDCGINIMDVFMPGDEIRTNIGKALAGRRDKIMIQGHIGSVDLNQQYDVSRDLAICKQYFEKMLRCMNTDYIDFGMLFFLDTQAEIDTILNNGVVDYARELKQKGTIRAIGASAHNPDTARRLVEEGIVDMMMFSINPAFDMMPGKSDPLEILTGSHLSQQVTEVDPNRADFYRLCESRGVGLTVMKSLGAGKLLSAEHTPFAKAMTPAQCIHYALTRPAVVSALVGCQTRAEVEAAAAYADMDDAQKDYSEAISAFRGDGKGGFSGSCVYCNHCLPCPSEIDVASVNKYLDIAKLDEANIPPSVAQHYKALGSHGSDCIQCGNCEERCPFGVKIMENMQHATKVFGI